MHYYEISLRPWYYVFLTLGPQLDCRQQFITQTLDNNDRHLKVSQLRRRLQGNLEYLPIYSKLPFGPSLTFISKPM